MNEELNRLKIRIEELRRTTKEKAKDIIYVDWGNNLDKLMSLANVVIYGRRGSGKTTILTKGTIDSKNRDIISAYIQCEIYKDHTYPNLLINILIKIFQQLEENTSNLIFSNSRDLKKRLKNEIETLSKFLESPDNCSIQQNEKEVTEFTNHSEASIKNKGASLSSSKGDNCLKETSKSFTIEKDKIIHLTHHIDRYRNLIEEFIKIKKVNALFLMFDDYYLLNLKDQPFVIDYIFKICKDQKAYFKMSTIRHRTNLYIRTPESKIRGVQEGADHSSIDLDFSLEQFDKTKDFLIKILDNTSESCKIKDFSTYFVNNQNGLPRLIWASGGVPRDFLILIGHLLTFIEDEKNIKFSKLQIDKAAYRLFQEKLQDLNSDYALDKQVKHFFEKIRNFTLIFNKKTAFIIKENSVSSDTLNKINNLIDHRLIHKVASNISLTKYRGPFMAYIIDVGSYSNYLTIKRKENKIKEINILKKDPYKKDTLLEIRALNDKNEVTDKNLKESDTFLEQEKIKVNNTKIDLSYNDLVQKSIFDF